MNNENKDYVAWLSQYTEKLSQMDEHQLREENHEDFYDDSQTYADYLDYVDEWKWHASDKVTEIISRYIYIASKRHMRVKCQCGKTHVLSTDKDRQLGDVIVDEIGTPMYTQCWYHTIARAGHSILPILKHNNQRLPDPIETHMHKIVRMKMAMDGQTPILLPYDIYQAIWWGIDSDKEFALQLLDALGRSESKDLKVVKHTLTPKVYRKEVLLNFPDSDHGMHALIDSLSDNDRGEIIRFINKKRTELDPSARRITYKTISERKDTCEYCKVRPYPASLSYPGIYYAPPGGGKTTSQNMELLVGFDTDWIGIGLSWPDYATILTKRIPIITNQPEIFIGSGVKVFGIVPKKIRSGLDGKPLDDQNRLLKWSSEHDRNTLFIKSETDEYLADYVIQLIMLAMLQQMIANQTLNKLPFYRNLQDNEWSRKFPRLLRRREREECGECTSQIV